MWVPISSHARMEDKLLVQSLKITVPVNALLTLLERIVKFRSPLAKMV